MAPVKRKASLSIYQIKVTLRDSKPPIWRRIQVGSDISLYKLHQILQAVMGWSGYHLHQFIIGGEYYGEPHPDYDFEMIDEKKVKLSEVVFGAKDKFIYEYDFGDSWEHEITIEKVFPPEAGVHYPVCLTGKRACPPDDCGGVWGYEGFLEAIRNPDHPEHDDMLEWIGGSFDPEEFNLDEINQRLKHIR
jgi:hypothetical protein